MVNIKVYFKYFTAYKSDDVYLTKRLNTVLNNRKRTRLMCYSFFCTLCPYPSISIIIYIRILLSTPNNVW